MAKLYFRYGAMNSGKSTALLQAAFNYEERGHNVLIAKPALDTKGDDQVVSRLGLTRTVDFTVDSSADIYLTFQQHRSHILNTRGRDVSALLIDEAQFFTEAQIDDLLRIALLEDVPVLAYGIRTDFQTVAFPGSRRLLEVAHAIEELKTICRCGRKAIFNARVIDGEYVFDGAQVAIDEGAQLQASVTYESLCGLCYLQESHGTLNNGRRHWPGGAAPAYADAPDADFM
ncbi:thymidine kinase [Gryllotalpicola protaetiae]|uniref:Thymidine kinase n=1 Tax=Gryllotalpicola protaetiae TaxID=2419771 RepID=A0A387BNW6_9MICO|nr:thymidine kinase [Gryllotalpicola protaetiae]AYG04162.1 thymidine kinase [Gryllotalpicola protaetiae]